MEVWRKDLYLSHSAKRAAWRKHKYISIENGRYIYPVYPKKIEPINKIMPVVNPREPSITLPRNPKEPIKITPISPKEPIGKIMPVKPNDPGYKIMPVVEPKKDKPDDKKDKIKKKLKRVRKLKFKYLK